MSSSNRHNGRGQASSIDALVGLALFLIVFGTFTNNFSSLLPQKSALYDDAYSRGQLISFQLTESAGSPATWNTTNYSLIGLSTGQPLVLSSWKMLQLAAANYSNAEDALGAGEYNLQVQLQYANGSVQSFARNRTLKVAYTNAGQSSTFGDASHFGIRNWMDNNGISYDNYNQTASVTDAVNLIGNLSAYDTAIFESTSLNSGQLTAGQQASLQSWVQSGGVLLYRGGGSLVNLLNVTSHAGATGTVTGAGAGDPFMEYVLPYDQFTCTSSNAVSASGASLNTTVLDNNGNSEVAWWNYGSGLVYFVCDTQGSVSGSVTMSDLRDAYNLYDVFGLLLSTGNSPANATVVAPVRRIVTYNNATAILQVTLWK